MSAVLDQARKSSVLAHLEGKSWGETAPVGKPRLRPVQASEPAISISPQTVTSAQSDRSSQAGESQHLIYEPGTSLRRLLQQTIEIGASDLHLHSGTNLLVRRGGNICNASTEILKSQECERLVTSIMDEAQLKCLQDKFQVDFAYEIPSVGRFRANVYKQQRGYDAIFRAIGSTPPTLAELELPDDFRRFMDFHQGLILFTGPAGCGKSSTMAAIVNLINQNRPDHILTIEDPIEYVYPAGECNVTQREIGYQTDSFPTALRAALREDPDVIVIGELRDLETISLAVTAAETGHLVLATLHTSNAIRTINRLLGVFPPDQLSQIRRMLSESLKAVISQRLVKRADGRGQVPAVEVMINNNATANLIRENRTHQIKSILQTGGAQGQRLLDASLARLVKDKVISRTEALKHAEEPKNFM